MSVLAVVDADKVHDYVFSPHELRLVRGGSALQSFINEDELPGFASACNGTLIYAAEAQSWFPLRKRSRPGTSAQRRRIATRIGL